LSERNIEMLRRAWTSFVDRDISGLDYLHPDVEFEVGPETLPDGGVFRGLEGFREVVTQWASAWAEYHQEPREFIDLGDDRAIVVAHTTGRSRGTGLEFEMDTFYVYEFADGRIRRISTARDRAHALRLAGGAVD
jgi:ketosteroid isomerase-like protein